MPYRNNFLHPVHIVSTRYIFLVRHGQNDHTSPPPDRSGGGLTAIGRQQAAATAERLAALLSPLRNETPANEGLPPAGAPGCIHTSTLRRARQTAEIIGARFLDTPLEISQDLEECIPYLPQKYLKWRRSLPETEDVPVPDTTDLAFWHSRIPAHASWAWVESGVVRAKRCFTKYFLPARSAPEVEIIVSHGNMIRYLICRAMGVPARCWVDLDIRNCGIAEVRINALQGCRVYSHNDTGHLPVHLHTFI